MRCTYMLAGLFVLWGCGKSLQPDKVAVYDSLFIPYSMSSGRYVDAERIIKLCGQQEILEDYDSSVRVTYKIANLDDDVEYEIFLNFSPVRWGNHYTFFLDQQRGQYKFTGMIGQGIDFYSRDSVAFFDEENKIFWTEQFMNGDCMGGAYNEGYMLINGKVVNVIHVPVHHSGCCEDLTGHGPNYCVALNFDSLFFADRNVTIKSRFSKSKAVHWEDQNHQEIFNRQYAFELRFDSVEMKYMPVDTSEIRFVWTGEFGDTWFYPPVDAYTMEHYLISKYHLQLQ